MEHASRHRGRRGPLGSGGEVMWWMALASAAECPDAPVVTYNGRVFQATLCTSGAFAGATLRKASDGSHFDLPAAEVRTGPDGEPIPVTLRAEVGPGYVQYILAAWDRKVPCSEGRHGCTAYGYLLDEPVESYPPYAYDATIESPFLDLRPVRVSVMDAGGGPLAKSVLTALPSAGWTVVDGGPATNPRSEVQILYRARWDRPKAWAIAAALREREIGYRFSVSQWPEAPEAFVVAVGK